MKIGTQIRVTFPEHADELATIATVTEILSGGVVKAMIDDIQHPLFAHNQKPRGELFVAPGNYEEVG